MAPFPGVGEGVSSLQGILTDPGVSGRAATALLLSTDKSPEVLTALEDALSDKDWSVRAAAWLPLESLPSARRKLTAAKSTPGTP